MIVTSDLWGAQVFRKHQVSSRSRKNCGGAARCEPAKRGWDTVCTHRSALRKLSAEASQLQRTHY